MLRIVCLKLGTKYSAEYVNILADMVRRNLPDGHPGQFVCFTDDPIGLDASIAVRELPGNLEGWFNKIYLFKHGLFDDGDRILYFDLDTVIVGALDQIVAYDGDFAILRDFYRSKGLQSSVMAWEANSVSFLWDEYEREGFPEPAGGDQAWIERQNHILRAEILQDIFPKAFVSFKADCAKLPPRGAKVVVFHGEPRPHNCGADWVKAVWAINGGQGFDLEQICNTADAKIAANVRSSMAQELPWLDKAEAHEGTAVIVGGGPSLRSKLGEIALHQAHGATIFATNGTAKFLARNGITPDFHVVLDARPENAEFVSEPMDGTDYLIASQCDPRVYQNLKGYPVTVWHPYVPLIAEIVCHDPKPVHMVGCGSTVCLKAIGIAHAMGYRSFGLYGMDSSYDADQHHAYSQPQNDSDRILDVQVGEKLFKAAPWMVSQANEFQDLAAYLANEGCTFSVAGEGTLLHHVALSLMAPSEHPADQRARAILSALPDGPVVGAEIGVFAGDLSARLLSRDDLTLYMVDSWRGAGVDYTGDSGDFHAGLSQSKQDAYKAHAIAVTAFAGERAIVLAKPSVEAAAAVPDGSLDFVFIDADHSYEGCSADIAAWLPKLKQGGVLSGHDYDNTDFPKFGVKRAVDEFASFHGCQITLGENFTWFIRNSDLRKVA